MKRRVAERWWMVLSATALGWTLPATAQSPQNAPQNTQNAKSAEIEAASLPLRTALYHDPTLAAPLDRLLQLYREAGRARELVDTYRQHVAQYPADAGAQIILIRLLAATNDAQQGPIVVAAAKKFPDNAYLQYLLFEHLQKNHSASALDALDRAIARETLPARQRAWIEQLVPLAMVSGRPELAQQRLETLAANSPTAEGKLEVARKLIAQKLYASALSVLESAAVLKPAAETGVEVELAAASTELGLKRDAAAALRLDRLLGRLAPDYWRRTEILHRRTALVKTDADREAMLNSARSRMKAALLQDGPALELAQLLTAFEFRREALEMLQEAGRRIPGSEKLEKATLELFDRLRDERGREAFLAARLKLTPDRQDLALEHARALFLLGRRDEALAVFDQLTARLEAAARLTQILEMARFLRRSVLQTEATALFERAAKLAPGRLDIRRELAETWLALGQKANARAVFAEKLPEQTESENLLDLIQFFLKQEMFVEARSALAERLVKEPQNFDLRLMQLTVATRLAESASGEQLVLSIREIADTEARYRRWLESAIAFYEVSESEKAFLAAEQERLLASPGGWGGESRERRLIFCELAAARGRKTETAALIDSALAGELPTDLRVDLRRRQLALIEVEPARSSSVETQLQALIRDDPAREPEYRIRLALLAAREKRTDKLMAILGEGASHIDVKRVNDAALLTALENFLRTLGGGSPEVLYAILERLTVLEPANRAVWERWITTVALRQDEEALQATLRRLLAGIDRMPMGDEVQKLLKAHLLASHWRLIARLVGDTDGNPERLSEALPALDTAGRLADSRAEWLWITWSRAYVLNRLGRREARDEAIRELERVAALPVATKAEPGKNPVPQGASIVFPDGLMIAFEQARELLMSAPGTQIPAAPAASTGPRGPLKTRWAFETEGHSPMASVRPLDSDHLLVCDASGRLYSLETVSGKFCWSREGSRPVGQVPDPYRGTNGIPSYAAPLVHTGRIFLPTTEGIECYSGQDGHLLWRAKGLCSKNTLVYPSLFAHAGRLLVCDPAQGQILALDPANGKVVWEKKYPRQEASSALSALNCGATFSEGRIFLYGASVVVVNATTGDLQWTFSSAPAPEFPLSLSDPGPAATRPPVFSPASFRGRYSSWGGVRGNPRFMAFDYRASQAAPINWNPQGGQQMILANPGVAWARNDDYGLRFAILNGERLLLGSNQGLRLVRLDLPFASTNTAASGFSLGVTGRFVCLSSGNTVTVLDTESGAASSLSNTAQPDDLTAEDEFGNVQPGMRAALDGNLIYLTNPRGVSLYQLRNCQLLSFTPWPKNVQPAKVAPQPNQPLLLNQGYLPASGATFALAAGGVLYTESEPGRLVALVAAAP